MRYDITVAMVLSMVLATCSIVAQETWGAGNDRGVKVSSSSAWNPQGWKRTALAENTINGSGLDARVLETSRFLAQATLGVEPEVMEEISKMDYEDWIDQQLELPYTTMLETLDDTWKEVVDWYVLNGGDSTDVYGPYWKDFNYAWWTANMTSDAYLRHRVALALSEIFVISINSELEAFGMGLASYYDVLLCHGLGNYRDLLMDVTLHPCMGHYLSHLNNPKADTSHNIRPDENYAREIMQLFSIGLFELNADGTRRKDADGQDIPTYGQNEIAAFAKIFTGLGISEIIENPWIDSARFDLSIYVADMTKPMRMYEEWHQQGQKVLLNGLVIPSGQDGMQDIEDALDNLFFHPNVGPFISRLLIQRLIKSNPSSDYIERIVHVFNDNGQGERGDLGAVVKAILLDDEARSCRSMSEFESARLREPLVRYTHFARSIDREHVYGRNWNTNYTFWDEVGQSPLASPTVFNFFLPDYQPHGEIGKEGLYAPEYQLHNTKLSIGYINHVNAWVVWNSLFSDWEANSPNVSINVDEYKDLAQDPEALLNELDKIYTHGSLTQTTRSIIKKALNTIIYNDYKEDRVRLAMYLILISPDYNVMR